MRDNEVFCEVQIKINKIFKKKINQSTLSFSLKLNKLQEMFEK